MNMENAKILKRDKLRIAIGEVVINFQFIEYELSDILSVLLNMKEKEDKHRIFAAMSFRQKTDLVCDLYESRKKPSWKEPVKISEVRKALNTAEEFRNSVVHSFYYVSGSKKPVWMRSKYSIRTSTGLKVVDGVADISSIEKGAKSLLVIREWYLGETEKLKEATKNLSGCTKRLSRKINVA